ncbi:MAG: hypothetical protein ACRDPW_05290, partial [Mycobacteriales bacterium]
APGTDNAACRRAGTVERERVPVVRASYHGYLQAKEYANSIDAVTGEVSNFGQRAPYQIAVAQARPNLGDAPVTSISVISTISAAADNGDLSSASRRHADPVRDAGRQRSARGRHAVRWQRSASRSARRHTRGCRFTQQRRAGAATAARQRRGGETAVRAGQLRRSHAFVRVRLAVTSTTIDT